MPNLWFLRLLLFRNIWFWHTHTNTQIEKKNIYIVKLNLFTSSMMIYYKKIYGKPQNGEMYPGFCIPCMKQPQNSFENK